MYNFITVAQLYRYYQFFSILPVFHTKTGQSDSGFGTYVKSYIYPEIFIKIGPFFNFDPLPGQTLSILNKDFFETVDKRFDAEVGLKSMCTKKSL